MSGWQAKRILSRAPDEVLVVIVLLSQCLTLCQEADVVFWSYSNHLRFDGTRPLLGLPSILGGGGGASNPVLTLNQAQGGGGGGHVVRGEIGTMRINDFTGNEPAFQNG